MMTPTVLLTHLISHANGNGAPLFVATLRLGISGGGGGFTHRSAGKGVGKKGGDER